MVLVIDLHLPGVPFTTRTTSTVLAIFPFPLSPVPEARGAESGID
jgi:hypothetical protein